MIAKLESIAHLKNTLSYCEKGGEVIYTNLCLGNSKDIYLQMLEHNAFNDRCPKHTFHIKIRIAPEDKGKLNIQDWIDISKDYATKIGFQDNPFALYIHEEGTENEHIHCVSSRIKPNNLAVSDSYTHYDNMDFCRELEQNNKYNLRKVKRVFETVKNNEVFKSSDKRIQPLKEKIFKAIDMSDSMNDIIFHLKNQGIKVKIGRGIGFIDEKGVYFKGSTIDRKLSLLGIKKLLSYENQEKQLNNNDFKSSLDINISNKKNNLNSNTNFIPFSKENENQPVTSNNKQNVNSTPNSKILDHIEIKIIQKLDNKINPEMLQKISKMCAAEYGFKNNQFNVSLNRTDNEVLLIKPKMNIDFNNSQAISQNDIFCAKIEKAFNLQKFEIVPKASSILNNNSETIDLRNLILKEKIIDIQASSNDSKSFQLNLKNQGIQIHIDPTDITFSDKKGTSLKVSHLNHRYNREAFDRSISKDNTTLKANPTDDIESIFFDFMSNILYNLINSNNELDDSNDSAKKKSIKRKKTRKL